MAGPAEARRREPVRGLAVRHTTRTYTQTGHSPTPPSLPVSQCFKVKPPSLPALRCRTKKKRREESKVDRSWCVLTNYHKWTNSGEDGQRTECSRQPTRAHAPSLTPSPSLTCSTCLTLFPPRPYSRRTISGSTRLEHHAQLLPASHAQRGPPNLPASQCFHTLIPAIN